MTGSAPTSDRRSRRREQTRTRLIEAARVEFARRGIDATRINEITETADVGFGSFYNHFESKDEIVAAVIERVAAEAAEAIAAGTADLKDPAEVVSVAHRTLVARAATDPEFGWLLVRLDVSHDLAFSALGPYAMRDLRRGVKAGRFAVADPALALNAAGGALLAVMRSVLVGRAPKRAAELHAEGVLRLLGLPADEAAAVAARPMP